MKEEKEINITHLMTFTYTDNYNYNMFKNNEIINQYDSIDKIEKLKCSNGSILLVIRGTKTIVGYKIDGRGFYDVINDIFYQQSYLDSLPKVEIKEIDGTVKKMIKKNKIQ